MAEQQTLQPNSTTSHSPHNQEGPVGSTNSSSSMEARQYQGGAKHSSESNGEYEEKHGRPSQHHHHYRRSSRERSRERRRRRTPSPEPYHRHQHHQREYNDSGPQEPIVYAQGLKPEVTNSDLEAFFSKYGTVKKAHVVCDRNQVSRGFAFITMSSMQELDKAINDASSAQIDGNPFVVQVARSKAPRPETPGRYLGHRARRNTYGGFPSHRRSPPYAPQPHYPSPSYPSHPSYDSYGGGSSSSSSHGGYSGSYPPQSYNSGAPSSPPPLPPPRSASRYNPYPNPSSYPGDYPPSSSSSSLSYPASNYPSSYSKRHDPYLQEGYQHYAQPPMQQQPYHHGYSSRRRSNSPYSSSSSSSRRRRRSKS